MMEEQDVRLKRAVIPAKRDRFTIRVLTVCGIVALFAALAVIVWLSVDALLLIFSAVLLAILLDAASERVGTWLRLPRWAALGAVLATAAAAFGIAGWILAPQVNEQAHELLVTVPESLQRFQAWMEQHSFLRSLLRKVPARDEIGANASAVIKSAGLAFSGVLDVLGNTLIILFVGVYLAMQPGLYINAMIRLLPPEKRRRGRAVLQEIGMTLSQWLVGKLLSMVIVGVATATGLSLLDVPLALVLGVLAGLLDFIPYIGPVIAAVPAVLIAFSESPTLALYVVLLFTGLQLAEGYLLQPLVERKTVSLPPALTISMQVLLGSVFGMAGVALATPLTAAVMVLTVMLYVQDVLGDPVPTPVEEKEG